MEIKVAVTSEIDVHFPIRVDWTEAESIINNDEVDIDKLRAYIVSQAADNTAFFDNFTYWGDYLDTTEAENHYTFVGCQGYEDDGESVVFRVGVCCEFDDTVKLDLDTEGRLGVELTAKLRNEGEWLANTIAHYKDDEVLSREVPYTEAFNTTVTLNGVEKTFPNELALENTLDAFITEALQKNHKKDKIER